MRQFWARSNGLLDRSSLTPYTFGLSLLLIGLTLSPFLMSVAQFWLVAVWITDNVQFKQPFGSVCRQIGQNVKAKLVAFCHNRIALVVTLLYVLHVIGLLWTSDFAYAFKDLRVKLPLLILPLIMSTMPQTDRRQTSGILAVYVASVFVATLLSFYKYVTSDYSDIRQISTIISHIRFSLNILLCVCVLMYAVVRGEILWMRLLSAVLTIWFLLQIYIMQVLAAYMILFVLVVFSVFYLLITSGLGRKTKVVLSLLTAAVVIAAVVLVVRIALPLFKVEKVEWAKLPVMTAHGDYYYHDTIYTGVEDGRYIGLYYCENELRESWNKRSEISFDDTIADGAKVKHVLMRYMTSKNLTKDAVGMEQMSDDDVRNVEKGVNNYNNLIHPGLRARISILAFELGNYRWTGNPNGGSASQRLEYNKASFYLIKRHTLFGVGTGDIPNAYKQAYEEMNSSLDEQHRYKAHNQYLSIMVGFGVIGLLIFLFSLFCPYIMSKNKWNFLSISFLLILLLSMLPEDTIETQAGATFFAFFNAFFLFTIPDDEFK